MRRAFSPGFLHRNVRTPTNRQRFLMRSNKGLGTILRMAGPANTHRQEHRAQTGINRPDGALRMCPVQL